MWAGTEQIDPWKRPPKKLMMTLPVRDVLDHFDRGRQSLLDAPVVLDVKLTLDDFERVVPLQRALDLDIQLESVEAEQLVEPIDASVAHRKRGRAHEPDVLGLAGELNEVILRGRS